MSETVPANAPSQPRRRRCIGCRAVLSRLAGSTSLCSPCSLLWMPATASRWQCDRREEAETLTLPGDLRQVFGGEDLAWAEELDAYRKRVDAIVQVLRPIIEELTEKLVRETDLSCEEAEARAEQVVFGAYRELSGEQERG